MKWYAWTIIALIAALGVETYLWQRDVQLRKSCEEIAHLQYVTYHDEAVKYTVANNALTDSVAHHKHKTDSVIQHYAPKLDAANALIKRQRSQLASVAVIVEADSSEFTEAQLHIRDSLIDSQDQQIANLYGERAALKISTEALIDNLEAKARLSEDEVSKWIGRYQASEAGRMADEKAWRRQRRLERIVEGVIVVGVIILAI